MASVKNAAFERLHPRDKRGRGAGQFVDVQGVLARVGEWDAPRGVWLVPSSRRDEVDQLLAEVGWTAISVPEGMRPASDEDRGRLKVPPAWTDVFVSDDPTSRLVAIGRDQAGRRQARYSTAHSEAQAKEKFARVKAFADALPLVDQRLSEDAPTDDAAAALMLIRKMGLRPGSNRDTRAAQQAFGATTLQRRHVKVSGDTIHLKFVGKKGVPIDLEIEDRELARVLGSRLKGKTGNEPIFDTNENLVRRWLENVAPGFKPKDFRTHKATAEALSMLKTLPPPTTASEAKKLRNQIGDYVSSQLGNTRTIALASYIDPTIFAAWEDLP